MSETLLAVIGAAIPAIIFSVTVVSLALAASEAFALTDRQATSMVVALYAIPGVLTLVIAFILRQPIMMAWSVTAMIFVTSQADRFSYSEVIGGTFVAGLIMLVAGTLGFTDRLATIIPTPIVFGVVAGSVLPYVARIFDDLADEPVMIGATLAAYLLGRRFLSQRVPAILLAVVVGFLVAGLTGEIDRLPAGLAVPEVMVGWPTFSWRAIASIAPVVAVLIGVQSTLSTVVILRSEGYRPPDRMIHAVCGAGTMFGSLFGLVPITTANFLTPILAGPEAGEHRRRYWSLFILGPVFILVALTGSVVADIPDAMPVSLLFALAGLALVAVLAQSLGEIVRGPLRLGPLFAFVVATSQMTMFGFGPLFWALVIGLAVSLLLESDELASLRRAA